MDTKSWEAPEKDGDPKYLGITKLDHRHNQLGLTDSRLTEDEILRPIRGI